MKASNLVCFISFFLWMSAAIVFGFTFDLMDEEKIISNINWVILGALVATASFFLHSPIIRLLDKLKPKKLSQKHDRL